MALRIGINGFGRIGRNVLRSAWNDPDIEFAHINDLTSGDMLAHLLKNDSVHGRFGHDVKAVEGGILIDGKLVTTTAQRDPSLIPWGDANVDVVLECTGVFTKGETASKHLTAGAHKVIISAPGTGVPTYVFGVNHTDYNAATEHVVSNASCTTNCLAPFAKVLNDLVGIEKGLMTTIHAYTMDQNLLDAPHAKGDFRRARAAGVNMVPSTTGAAKAIGLVLPALQGKLHGMAVRVPTPNVSIVDLVFNAGRDTSADEINAALVAAAEGPLRGVLAAERAPLVSSDLIGHPASSIVDLEQTSVIGGNLVKVMAWYDNEWGFSCRMIDLAKVVGA